MHMGAMPETMLERLALGLGLVPTPLIDTSGSFILARMVIAATQLGIFEALAAHALTAPELAAKCEAHAGAAQQLLDTLASSGYVLAHGGRYRLTPRSRRWLLKTSPTSLHDAILFAAIEWDWMSHLSEFIRSGTPLDFHATMAPEHWALYQRAMRSLANIGAPEVARAARLVDPANAVIVVVGDRKVIEPKLRALGLGDVVVRSSLADGSVLQVSVTDSGEEQPEMQPLDPDRVGGVGLRIVDRLATDWGVASFPGGKTVWALLECAPA